MRSDFSDQAHLDRSRLELVEPGPTYLRERKRPSRRIRWDRLICVLIALITLAYIGLHLLAEHLTRG